MRGPTFTPWMQITPAPSNNAAPQSAPILDPFYRNLLDRALAARNINPQAQFPDGYLGTVTDRQNGKLDTRQNERSGLRGVHKGEIISPRDYFWPDEFGPMNGIKAEMRGQRQVPIQQMGAGPNYVGDVTGLPRGAQSVVMSDPVRAAALRSVAPSWR